MTFWCVIDLWNLFTKRFFYASKKVLFFFRRGVVYGGLSSKVLLLERITVFYIFFKTLNADTTFYTSEVDLFNMEYGLIAIGYYTLFVKYWDSILLFIVS